MVVEEVVDELGYHQKQQGAKEERHGQDSLEWDEEEKIGEVFSKKLD